MAMLNNQMVIHFSIEITMLLGIPHLKKPPGFRNSHGKAVCQEHLGLTSH